MVMVSQMAHPTIQTGVYQHFKGGLYEVVGVAKLVDSDAWYVVYRPLYGDRGLVMRPFDDFFSKVVRNGEEQPRFRLLQACPILTSPGAT